MSTDPVKTQNQQQQPPPQHQQPLHNFALPSLLKWQSSNGSGRVRRESHTTRAHASPKGRCGGGHAVGDTNPKTEDLDGVGLEEREDGRKPWKLRSRRAVTATAAAAMGLRNGKQEGGAANRLRRNGDGGEMKKEDEKEEGKKRRLWIALTKEEIEEDVFIMTGCRPSRRPKKRSKTAQKQLDRMHIVWRRHNRRGEKKHSKKASLFTSLTKCSNKGNYKIYDATGRLLRSNSGDA